MATKKSPFALDIGQGVLKTLGDEDMETLGKFEPKQGNMELKYYLQIARKWWWFVIVSMVVGGGLGYMIGLILPPVYHASTSLLVKSRNASNNSDLADEYVAATYKELLAKRPIIEATALSLNLDPLETQKKIWVNLIPGTSLIELTAEANDPHLAMAMANRMVSTFIEISRETGGVNVRNLVIVEPAALPLEPVSPGKLRIILVTTMLGLVMASGAVFLIEYLDDTLKSSEDIHYDLSLPTLTVVPRLARGKRANALLTVDNPDPRLTEAYRILRTRLQFSQPDGNLQTLLIASPLSWTESAHVVINLGVVIAQSGRKVLLVDANLRQPQLHHLFEVDQEPGLSTLLTKTGADQINMLETGLPNLYLLPSGPMPPDPLVLLESPQTIRLIEKLKTQADIILFNAPPLLTGADTTLLATRVEGTLLVVKSQSTQRQPAVQALKTLHNTNAKVLGVVLEGIKARSSQYHYYSDFPQLDKLESKPLANQNHNKANSKEAFIFSKSELTSKSLEPPDRV